MQTFRGVASARRDEYYDGAPTHNLTPMPFKDMPEPLSLGKVLGPSVILAGLGVGSGDRRALPEAIKLKGLRLGIMVVCLLFFTFFAAWLIIASIQGLLGG